MFASSANEQSFPTMRVFPRLKFWRTLRYRLFIAGVGLAYLLAALDIPLPVAIHKDASQPFPCQDHPCGCKNAEQCWTSCCCFTAEERWAWARAHHVEPPAYAEKPAAHGWNTAKLRDRDTTTESCCHAHQPAAPARVALASAAGWWTTTLAAWRCQGYSTLWVSAGSVLPVPPLAAWRPDSNPPARVCLPSVDADKVPSIPPDPPPRVSLV